MRRTLRIFQPRNLTCGRDLVSPLQGELWCWSLRRVVPDALLSCPFRAFIDAIIEE